MEYKFIEKDIDLKNLQKTDEINPFLLENNFKQVEQICDFFSSDSKLLLLNGFMGTGKTTILSYVINALNCITIKYKCFETTILDDILLSIFNDFKNLSEKGLIELPKNRSENFTQKINAYFKINKKPILLIIDSFSETIKKNRVEIYDFIRHLCTLPYVKIVLVSRKFDFEDFDINYKKVTTLGLEKNIFEKYLRANDLKQIGPLSDELYKNTRGYFFYTTLSLKIMRIKNLSLIDFLSAYSKSFLTFNDFILREALSLVDPVSGHLFRFLTIMRHPISIELLKTLQLYNEERTQYFVDNLLLSKHKNLIYLKNYYKEIAENSISKNVITKLHQGCVELYETQLPLKPMERDLLISRQTMRNEIEYHSTFIPKKISIIPQKPIKEEKEKIEETTTIVEEPKEEKIKKMSFIFDDDDTGVLDKIANSIKDFLVFNDKRKAEDEKENKLSLLELVNLAKQKETEFKYKHAISLYLKALKYTNDEDFYNYLPKIYTQLAYNYQNCSSWFEAKKYFEMAKNFYDSTGDLEKINEMQYNIANVYYMTFKKDDAKEILEQIEKEQISDELRIKVYNLLANIITKPDISYEYYKKAIEINPININKETLAELYYKFALANEDLGDENTAAKYYKKCIDLKETSYLSSAISNIATLYDDIGERDLAIKYYFESLKIDEKNKNLNGIFACSMKLAEIFAPRDIEKAIEYYNKSIEIAYELKENFYIISATTALGDFYFYRNENALAFNNYRVALDLTKNSQYKDNYDKIQQRLNDLKIKIGEERFKELEK